MIMTIEYRGVEFDVEFDYDPAEEQTRDHEGCAAQVHITEFKHQGTCFLEWIEWDEDVNQLILENL
tara:strand:+ start:258 stop:455 length:198 start_codon:yes stop_codon:yes gene_type:complete